MTRTLNTLMRGIHSSITSDNMFPLSLLETNQASVLKKKFPSLVPTLKEARDVATYLGCGLGDLYIVTNSFYPFCYYKDHLYLDLLSLDVGALGFMRVKDQIKARGEQLRKYLEDKDYHSFFMVAVEKRIAFYTYKLLFDEIPDEDKYPIFIDLYTRSEYGFSMFDIEFMEALKGYRSKSYAEKVLTRLLPHTVDGRLTIYRGECSESTPYKRAFSWTLNLHTAVFFATRYGRGKVYQTTVGVNDVIDFLESRGESEILVSPNVLGEVKEIPFKSSADILRDLKWTGYVKRFQKYADRFNPEWFLNPDGIHGVSHCKRVLFLSLTLCKELGLSLSDERLLVNAALYHDIGRENDLEDDQHGIEGYKKMVSLGLGKMDDVEDAEILRYIIENHCVDDDLAVSYVDGYNISSQKLPYAIKMLKVFKDADGLDRVRLGDLDISYLRFDQSKHLKPLAEDLLRLIR